MGRKYQELRTELDMPARLVADDELHRRLFVRYQGRPCLDAFGRYWPLPDLRRLWARLAGRWRP